MATEVVSSKDDDPVLDQALSEMSSEGLLDEPGDLPEDGTSQAGADESAEGTAAPVKALGDDGSGKAVAAPAGEETDPFQGTEPFTYGEAKTPIEGVFRVPGEGLIVPEDKVSVIEQLAERADTLDRVSRDYESRNADYERLSEWRTTGPDGKEQVYQGRDGLIAMRTELGTRAASMDVLTSILKPNAQGQYVNLAKLVTVNDQNQIVPDPDVLERLLLQADLAERDARDKVRSDVGRLSEVSSTSATPDYSSQALTMIDEAAKSAGVDSKVFTQKDKGFLASQFPRYVRPATQADQRAHPTDTRYKVGSPVVDESWTQLVKDRSEMRAEATKQAQAAERAGKFNAGQQKGRQPVAQKTPTAPARPAAEKKTGKPDWDGPLEQALSEMDIARH